MGKERVNIHERWCKLIKEQERSDETIMNFCRQRGLAAHNFHYHKKRMKEKGEVSGFAQLGPAKRCGVSLSYDGEAWRMELEEDFDPGLLRAVVEALK